MKRLSRVTNIHDILLSATQNISFSHVFSSPKGYAIVHSLLSVTACFKRPSGTQIIFMANPAINRRATIARPSGTKCKPTSKCPNSRPLAGRDSCRPIQDDDQALLTQPTAGRALRACSFNPSRLSPLEHACRALESWPLEDSIANSWRSVGRAII